MPPRGKKGAAAAPAAPPAAAAPQPEGETTLTEYELQRLAHIRRNQEYMARLGVLQARRCFSVSVLFDKRKRLTSPRLCAVRFCAARA